MNIGYFWNRQPEVLSPVVFGLSGTLGRETLIRYRHPPTFEHSFFSTDPVHALFGVLDLAFIVKVVLSLAILLFTFDAVCGEKEGGTLRLFASFPVARSTLALAKLIGSTTAVLVPFVFSFLLASLVLALSPEVGLQGNDWMRMGALMVLFSLCLAIFAAFGVLVSALTHRRAVAFLSLLVLWTVWIFVVPNMSVRAARSFIPAPSHYHLQKQDLALRKQTRERAATEIHDFFQRHPMKDWRTLSEARRQEIREAYGKIQDRWEAEYRSRAGRLKTERRDRMRSQQRLAMVLSGISPLGAVDVVAMDLARTGIVQQKRLEDALQGYLIYLDQFTQDKYRQPREGTALATSVSDLAWFTYRDDEGVEECLSRNTAHILKLVLLAVLGFAGAYVAILRYDVR